MVKCPNCGSTAQVTLIHESSSREDDYGMIRIKEEKTCICGCGCEFKRVDLQSILNTGYTMILRQGG
jgi:rRNA maturation protein Nop10